MTDLPAPLLDTSIDLRDFRWMKLDITALLNSDFNATPDDTGWRAAVTLWMRAWHQVPAGSLPSDDATLCNLAGLGRDLKTWKRIKAVALHGFVLCSDGRIYHRHLCTMAQDAHDERKRFEARKQKDRERKKAAGSDGASDGNPQEVPQEDAEHSTGNPAEIAVEGQGEGEGDIKDGGGPAHTCTHEVDADRIARHFLAERDRLWPQSPNMPAPLLTLVAQAKGYAEEGAAPDLAEQEITRAMEAAHAKGDPNPPTNLRFCARSMRSRIAAAQGAAHDDAARNHHRRHAAYDPDEARRRTAEGFALAMGGGRGDGRAAP